MISIVVIAHAPLASAMVECAKHVLGHDPYVNAIDIQPGQCAADCATGVSDQLIALDRGEGVLVLTDLPGASPSNIAVKACHTVQEAGIPCCVLGGVNASMLLRAINYRQAGLDEVASCALAGANSALMRVD